MADKVSNGVKFMLGTKGKMTQFFDEKGIITPVTSVQAGPLTVTQVKGEKDGYTAVQVGFGARKESRTNKAQKGKLFNVLREYKPAADAPEAGSSLDISMFAVGDVVEISAISKGKGFQGVVKRHGFAGGPRSHGQKNKERSPGSIGGGGRAGGRVVKGMRMAGRMGGDRITVRNLRVVHIDAASNTLLISGAIPGRPGTLIEIRG